MREKTPSSPLQLEPGTLWPRTLESTAHARRCGALQPIATEIQFLEEGGVRFPVRILGHLARKETAQKTSSKQSNPFLPFERDLFVAEISNTHVCLLNKFNVIDHHLLLVTRQYEVQESPLTLADFEALGACLLEFDSLGFYNAGKIAGASQRHKHLQIVPLPLAPGGPRIPIEPLLASTPGQSTIGFIPTLPFRHALAPLAWPANDSPRQNAAMLWERYRALLQAFDLQKNESGPTAPYNLLLTREWMLLVPRRWECFHTVSVNALGFAGALLVRNREELTLLQTHGPLAALRHVA